MSETAELPIRYEMRTADGVVVCAWIVLPRLGPEPTELWRVDYRTGRQDRITGRWEEIRSR